MLQSAYLYQHKIMKLEDQMLSNTITLTKKAASSKKFQ